MASGYDGTIRIDSSIDSKGFNKGIGGMSAMVGKLGVALAAAFAVKKLAGFTVGVAKLTAEFQRLEIAAQAVGQLHGFAAEETRKLTGEMIDAGIQTDVANRAYINFVKEGLDANLLPALARGAQDLAVFADTGETSSDMLDRLIHGTLSMNTLMLRNAKVAIDVNEAWKQYGLTIDKTTSQMTIQEKRQAVLIAVMEELRRVSGLYELSQTTVAGQMASNTRIMNEFKAALGAPLQNAFFSLIKSWNTLIKTMTISIKEGGRFYGMMIKIGTVVAFVANMIAKLFYAIAGLFGYTPPAKSAVKGIADSAGGLGDATDGMGDLADATEGVGEAAKGALAPFDDLNVLAQDTGAGAGAGDAGGGLGDMGMGEINADDFIFPMEEITKKAQEMEAAFKKSWLGAELFPAIGRLFEAGAGFISVAIGKLRPHWEWFAENILAPVGDFAGWLLVELLDSITWALEEMTRMLEEDEKTFWVLIATIALFAIVLSGLGAPIWLIVLAIIAVIAIIKNWDRIIAWFGVQWETFTKWLSESLQTAIAGMPEPVKAVFNKIIGFVNGMVRAIVAGINAVVGALNSIQVTLPSWIPEYGGASFGVNMAYVATPQIPYLAKGAVIPPNAEFAAILGDQKSGTNIETPERLLRQIMREEMGGRGEQNINIKFTGSLAELARILKPVIDKEGNRQGGSLLAGGAI